MRYGSVYITLMHDKKEFYVICDNIRSLENIGSIFRTADAAGISKIYLCGISGKPPIGKDHQNYVLENQQIAKTALGAEQIIPYEYHAQTWRLIQSLKENNIKIIALEQAEGAIDYREFKSTFPIALIVGNEVQGISKKTLAYADDIISLPMAGKKESLNVAVAFGVAAYRIQYNT
jgi:23S rRNA (guanosine2251-2'-O)-methyltransferase